MPNFGSTPEALLGRNDSKNPSTTCKGITSSGRPCRRALAASPRSSPLRRKSEALNGVVAIVQEDGEDTDAQFYCWQHKDQAEQIVAEEDKKNVGRRAKRRETELYPLKERSSIDTMVQRLGLDAVPEEESKARRKKTRNPRPPQYSETNDFAARPGGRATEKPDGTAPMRRKPKQKAGFWASLCCVAGGDDEDFVEIVRHKKRTESSRPPDSTAAAPPRIPPNKPTDSRRQSGTSVPARKPVSDGSGRPPVKQRSSSNAHTSQLLSLIPQHLTPTTTSALLAELIKPISPHDEEGYIYIFWLTPQSKDAPAESTARSLLTPQPQHQRRISDVMTEFSFDGSEPETRGKKTIMLKIGRANNITRRMNEWQRQCGYALNLVRWYPYVSSSTTPSPQPSPTRPQSQTLYPDLSRPNTGRRPSAQSEMVRKVPCVKRVERLIHLELHEQQVNRQCSACGKEHREWFEVEASQAGVKAVDECVRRWVGWAEREAVS